MGPDDLGALVLVLTTAAAVAAAAAWSRFGAVVWTPLSAGLLAAAALVAAAPEEVVLAEAPARTALVSAAALLAVLGGGPVTTRVFALVDRQDLRADLGRADEVLRGGAWIGALERAGVFVTLVAGWPEGVAVVLGLKGLGRYPELRSGENSGAAERFIIGTFSSVLWAAACAGLVRLLL